MSLTSVVLRRLSGVPASSAVPGGGPGLLAALVAAGGAAWTADRPLSEDPLLAESEGVVPRLRLPRLTRRLRDCGETGGGLVKRHRASLVIRDQTSERKTGMVLDLRHTYSEQPDNAVRPRTDQKRVRPLHDRRSR